MKCTLRTYISNQSENLRRKLNGFTDSKNQQAASDWTDEQVEEVLSTFRRILKLPDLDEDLFSKKD